MTIERAEECRKFFLESIEKKGELRIDLSGVVAMDLSGIQILVACMRKATESTREIHFTGSLSPEVQRTVAMAGLCEGECVTGETLERAILVYL
jgi:anti-anti-sigma factor